jgi:hypothetical protein
MSALKLLVPPKAQHNATISVSLYVSLSLSPSHTHMAAIDAAHAVAA